MTILKFTILLLLNTIAAAFGQVDEIYRLAFSDPTNFDIMNSLSYKQPKNIKRFYVSTTEPIFTSDGRFAFIELSVFLKGYIDYSDGRVFDDFGSVTIVYQKQTNGKWKKFKKFDYLIL